MFPCFPYNIFVARSSAEVREGDLDPREHQKPYDQRISEAIRREQSRLRNFIIVAIAASLLTC
jgi:hypothetical protein